MKLEAISIFPMWENIYVYYDETSLEACVIDPGFGFDKLKVFLTYNKLTVKAIFLTHGHFDHIFCADELRKLTGASIYAHEAETEILESASNNGSSRFGNNPFTLSANKFFKDGDVLEAAGCSLRVIHTPGHTLGSCCLYDEKSSVLFTGDTLFNRGVGRADFYSGDERELLSSIKTKLFTLPGETVVYPGHNESTTILQEAAENPYVS